MLLAPIINNKSANGQRIILKRMPKINIDIPIKIGGLNLTVEMAIEHMRLLKITYKIL